MGQPIVLALQQVMERQGLRRAIGPGPIGLHALRDDLGTSGDALQLQLERRRLLSIGMTQALVSRGELNDAPPRRAVFGAGLLDGVSQDLAVAFGRDRQAVLEVPGRETASARIVPQFDLALVQSLPVGGTQDRQQYAGARPVRQYVPIDVKRYRMRRSWTPFQHIEPPRIVCKMHADMVRNEIENEPEVVRFQCLA